MLFDFMGSGLSSRDAVMVFLIALVVFFVSIIFHELAHGFVAYKMGDLTPKMAGRLTLNPTKHMEVSGFLCFLIL